MNAKSSEPSDIEIVRRVLAGDVNTFEQLLKKYEQHVLMIVKRHIPHDRIEEIAQDVFVNAYKSLATFKKRNSFKQWLSTIAIRACCDYWRRAYRSRELPMCALTDAHRRWVEKVVADQSNRSFSAQGTQQEARELLDWALDRLSAEDRMVLELVYLEGLSGKEAADLLGWSVANVKVRSFRSRKNLRKLLAGLIKR